VIITISLLNGCVSEASNIIHAEVLDLFERSHHFFQVYPNPFHGKLIINPGSVLVSSFEISIVDVLGKEVYRQEDAQGYTNINLNYLPDGLYLMRLYFAAGKYKDQVLIIIDS
jgi:hypothetical protein